MHGMNTGIEAAFMTSSLVFMNYSLTRHPINNRGHALISGLCRGEITGVNGFDHFFDSSTHHRTLSGILLTIFFGLTGAFFRLCCISQSITPINTAIPAHAFNPVNTRDFKFGFRTIFQKNNWVAESPKERAGIAAINIKIEIDKKVSLLQKSF